MESRLSPPPNRSSVQRPTLLYALQRYWLVPVVLVVVLGALGAAVALARHPTYTAESLLVVGKVDVETPGLSGFVATTQSLASAYSRAVSTGAVVDPVSKELKLKPDEVSGQVSASPVPESPVFRISADGSSKRKATDLANATSRSLVRYIGNINRSSARESQTLTDLKVALVELNRLQDRRDQLQAAERRTPTTAARTALAQAEADVQTTQLKTKSLSTAYQASQSQPSTNLVQILSPARSATSDRGQRLQIYVFLGVVFGLILGIALARLMANRAALAAARVAVRGNSG
jgi:capsular polysaccharide biosynthesis protein